mgnify:CR=1 FL=1
MSDKEQKQSPIRVHVLSGYRPIEVFCIAYNVKSIAEVGNK